MCKTAYAALMIIRIFERREIDTIHIYDLEEALKKLEIESTYIFLGLALLYCMNTIIDDDGGEISLVNITNNHLLNLTKIILRS